MKFTIQDFFSKCDQNHSFLRIWSHLLKKSLTENFIFVQCLLQILLPKFGDQYFTKALWSYISDFISLLFRPIQ